MNTGWNCPSCGKAHAPHVETCPDVSENNPPTYPAWPDDSPRVKCVKCGIRLDAMMGYVCNRSDCPTGLGGATC